MNMSYKVIIIEDEEPATDLIKFFLAEHPEFKLLAECSNGFEGVKMVQDMKPDLIFLDIQMPKLTGFEVLELLDHKPIVIFSTAFDQFALKAFEANACDYLLKPYSKERFTEALHKAKARIELNQKQDHSALLEKIDEGRNLERVVVKSGSKITIIPVEEIIYIEATGDYVEIHTKQGGQIKDKTMKYFESNLDQKKFVRIHRSFIVNIAFIKKLEHFAKDSYVVILHNNKDLKVSSSGFKQLKSILNI